MYKDKVVIVTGASNGIGKAIAKAYLQEDAYVILADIDEEQGKHVLDSIEQKERAIFIKTDVRNEADIIQMVETTQAKFGKIDILINNAGKGIFKSFYDLTIEEWDDVINTNLRSVFLCSREVAKIMRTQGAKG